MFSVTATINFIGAMANGQEDDVLMHYSHDGANRQLQFFTPKGMFSVGQTVTITVS